jgi:capsular polysaccharide biosynthesis protein
MDATPGTPASSDLTQYGALLRRRWWVVVSFALIGLVAGGALLVTRPKVYTSSAQILIKDPSSDIAQQTGKKSTVNLDTEAAIMKSQQVAVRAKERLKTGEDATRLPHHIDVTAIPSSSVLAVTYNASSPAVAQRGAHEYAQAYLDNRIEQIKASNTKQIAAFRTQISSLDKQQKAMVQQILGLPGKSQEKLRLQAEVNRVQKQMQGFSEKIAELDGSATDPGEIISDSRPGQQTAPIMPLYLGSGFMIGLLFGIIIALWRDRADRRIRRAEDIERLLTIPVLLNVPVKGKNPIGLLPARSQGGQAFHELAHSLNATLGHGNHVVLVTGVTPGLGAGAICANLAAALARTDADVVLVCANLPSTYSARLLNLSEGPGLSEILVHGTPVSEVVQAPRELPRMRVITPGHDEDLAWERLQTQSMDRLIQGLRRHATHVIIEAPPTSTSADAQALAEIADASIVVVEIPRADREHVSEGIRQLDRMGTAVLGAVVLPVQPGTAPAARPQTDVLRRGESPRRSADRQAGPDRRGKQAARQPQGGRRRQGAATGSRGEPYADSAGAYQDAAAFQEQLPPPPPPVPSPPPPLARADANGGPDDYPDTSSADPHDAYGIPSSDAYGSSVGDSYGSSSSDAYGSSAGDSYGSSSSDAYGSSAGDSYGTSSSDAYSSSAGDSYGTSSSETYGDSHGDESAAGARPPGTTPGSAELFPLDMFKTQSFEAAPEPDPTYDAISDLVGPDEDDDDDDDVDGSAGGSRNSASGRVGDR